MLLSSAPFHVRSTKQLTIVMGKLAIISVSVFLVLLCCLLCVVGENNDLNYGGTLFAFSFLADDSKSPKKAQNVSNEREASCMIDLISADTKSTTINVTIPGMDFERTLTLLPGQVQRVNLSLGNHTLYGNANATVIVTSTRRIFVVAFVEFLRPTAAFQVIPAAYTGTRHVIANNYSKKITLFTITSLSDNNTVNVHAPEGKKFSCDKFKESLQNASVLMQKYETMFCKGKRVDLTGISVNSPYNLAVVAGGRIQFFGDTARRGYVMEQMLPQRAWGNHFAVAPFATINESNYVLKFLTPPRVVANVTIKGLNWTAEDFTVEGENYIGFNDSRGFDEVIEIFSDEPISVMQYMTGTPDRNATARSDPSMFNVLPVDRARARSLVDVFPSENQNIINIVIKCNYIVGLQVNGRDLRVDDERVLSSVNGTTYCALSYELEAGLHCVSHRSTTASFQIILYSWKKKGQGQNAYAMEAALDVPSDYPTCIPVFDYNPASQLQASFDALQEEDFCGNDTTGNRLADIALEIEELAMNMTVRMLAEGTSDIYKDLGIAVIEIKKINTSSADPSTIVSIPSKDNSTQPKTRGLISMEILQKLEVQAIISIVFRNLGEMMDNCSTSNDSSSDDSGTRQMVGSEVLSLTLYPPVSSALKLPSPVGMVFPMQSNLPARFANGDALCSFWNYTLGGWSQEGCWAEFVNSSLVECACDHLTNFAVLMQINDYQLSEAHEIAVNMITSVGCGLSVAGAFFTIFTFIILRLKSDRVMIHINLAIAVGIGQIMILFLDSPTTRQVECTVKASLLYYFYMSAFCWMLIEGVNLYLQAVVVFSKPGSRIKIYLVIGWLCPVIPLAATLGFYKGVLGDDVTDETIVHPVCFVRRDDDSIWFFVVPVLTIIALNVYFVARVVIEIIKLAGGPHVVNNRITRAKHGVKACIILLPVMGLTWIFGVMWQDQSTVVFMYLFVIFNSLQGFFIFVFHCLFNSEVRHTFQRKKVEWRNSFSRRSSFNLKVFRSDDSKKKQTMDTNKLSNIATPNGSHSNQNKDQ